MENRTRIKGETRKFLVSPKTIDDDIVKDGLEGVSLLNRDQPYFVVGGIATQSYLPSSCRRGTSDIDLCLVKPLNYASFKGMMQPVSEYLQDRGYDVETRKGSRAFGLILTSESGDSLIIEAPKQNKKSIDDNKALLQREIDNSRYKVVEERESPYRVSSPEDIAIPKLVRSINALKRHPGAIGGFLPSEMGALSDEEIAIRLKRIGDIRQEAMYNPGDPKLAERVRFISDLYDIRVLSELVGFNESYWLEAEEDWYTMRDNPKIKSRIMSVTVPSFNPGKSKLVTQ